MNHTKYMQKVLKLAFLGVGKVNPNPLVGCVIVKNNKIIATGYHHKWGEPHAERCAILSAKSKLNGSTLYVNLEPCCHYGKTPPCTNLIIEHKIKTVVIGCQDPNPLVAGKGIAQLKRAGVEVITNILEKECLELNRVFIHFIQKQMPYVIFKYAMTLDGKIATATGDSKWISNEVSRRYVQVMRNRYSAIMVGINTVLKDDPLLTCRLKNGRNPTRIICDTTLKIPLTSKIVKTAKTIRTIIATNNKNSRLAETLIAAGCEILFIPLKNKLLDLDLLMQKIAALNIDSVLLEGGAHLAGSMVKQRLVNELYTFISPQLIGDDKALGPIANLNIKVLNKSVKLSIKKIEQIKGDLLIESRLS